MSSDMAHNSSEDIKTVDDQAYEPTYAEAFPPLMTSEGGSISPPPTGEQQPNKWNKKMTLRSSTVTQVCTSRLDA